MPGAVYDLAGAIGAPRSLAAIGMSERDLDEAAGLIVEAAPHNPRPVTQAAMRSLLADAFAGRRPTQTSRAERPVTA